MTQHPSVSEHSGLVKPGRVVKKTLGHYTVRSGTRTVDCSLSSKLRKRLVYPHADPGSRRPSVDAVEDIRSLDPVAIGDEVMFSDAPHDTGMITEVRPRRNELKRRAPGPKPLEQTIAANVDQLVIVVAAAQPAPKWNLLDRYFAGAEAANIPPRLCITKIDLAKESRLMPEVAVYQEIGYPVAVTSAVARVGLDEFRESLAGRMSVLVGQSGVGKTTLLNAIQPGLGLRISEVNAKTGKGKHTTSHLEMFDLDCGGSVVDTPGMREFGLWRVADGDLADLFPEMRPYLGQCRFGADCSHSHEPGCAVKKAVDAGHIADRRYQSYLRMRC